MLGQLVVAANYSIFHKVIRLSTIVSLQVLLSFLGGFWHTSVNAQITPDKSLGTEASKVTPNVEIKGSPAQRIDGGAARGGNLFHSFSEFNVRESQRVYFNNPRGIENILTRVTGGKVSKILGTLGVDGRANLFFINPSGIVFGKNARLDVRGSFLGSTANSFVFSDDFKFSATNPQSPSLLKINVPIGLQFAGNPGRIENKSTTPAGIDLLGKPLSGLRVPDGKSFLLLGGDIVMDGGGLHAPNGRVELAGVGGNGTVKLNADKNNISLSFTKDIVRADISLSNGAFVNTSGEGGGGIGVWGKQVKLRDGSQIAATTLGANPGRGLTVNASEFLELTGTTADNRLPSGLFTQTAGTGNAGDITINTKNLLVQNRARVLTGTVNQGNAGNLTVNASESVQMSSPTGILPFAPSFSSRLGSDTGSDAESDTGVPFGSRLLLNPLVTQTSVTGKGGNVTILTKQLRIQGAARIGASTFSKGQGGNLTVNATELVQVVGGDLFAQANSIGDAGNLTINTRQLLLQDGAQVAVSSFAEGNGGSLTVNATESVQLIGNSANGQFPSGLLSRSERGSTGKAGDLTINTKHLLIKNSATVSTSTFSEGDGGNLTVNASESVQLMGFSANGKSSSTLNTQSNLSSIGKPGDLTINTRQMIIRDGAAVSVSSLGSGTAGNLQIKARSITLDKQGAINATTRSGNGGNITLKLKDFLLLRNGSQISTTAGNKQFGGDGGNITIDSPLIVAVPKENSDITANAFSGRGGDIDITTKGIFGIQVQSRLTENSDITASSDLGLGGDVSIDNPNADPPRGMEELPTDVVDAAGLINRNICVAARRGSEFVITGKGGLPPSPYNVFTPDSTWEDWSIGQQREISQSKPKSKPVTRKHSSHRKIKLKKREQLSQIVQAQDWVVDGNGNVVLTAKPVKVNSKGTWLHGEDCQRLRTGS